MQCCVSLPTRLTAVYISSAHLHSSASGLSSQNASRGSLETLSSCTATFLWAAAALSSSTLSQLQGPHMTTQQCYQLRMHYSMIMHSMIMHKSHISQQTMHHAR